jgi:hypothetical protein
MSTGRRIALGVGIALVAATGVLLPPTPARADNSCSLQDLGNAAQNTYNGFVNGQCAAALADPVAAALTVYLTTMVGGMGSQSGGFCQAVTDVTNWTNNAQNDINNVTSGLNKIDSSGQLASQFNSALNSVSGAIADAAGLESAFTCACSITAGLGQLFGDLGSCVEQGLCDFANAVHSIIPGIDACSGPPNVTWVNCMQDPCTGSGLNYTCNLPGGLWPEDCGTGPCTSGNGSIQCQPSGSGGGQVCAIVVGSDPNNGGLNIEACSCPAPRQMVWHTGVDGDGDPYPYETCDCPAGTSAAGAACICNNTGSVPQVPPIKGQANPEGVICPPSLVGKACPAGQQNFDGNCVPVCPSDDGMTLNGACCDPTQVTSCGFCCPPGTTPDPSSATCIPKQIAQ